MFLFFIAFSLLNPYSSSWSRMHICSPWSLHGRPCHGRLCARKSSWTCGRPRAMEGHVLASHRGPADELAPWRAACSQASTSSPRRLEEPAWTTSLERSVERGKGMRQLRQRRCGPAAAWRVAWASGLWRPERAVCSGGGLLPDCTAARSARRRRLAHGMLWRPWKPVVVSPQLVFPRFFELRFAWGRDFFWRKWFLRSILSLLVNFFATSANCWAVIVIKATYVTTFSKYSYFFYHSLHKRYHDILAIFVIFGLRLYLIEFKNKSPASRCPCFVNTMFEISGVFLDSAS
jgi:hypothetical protein